MDHVAVVPDTAWIDRGNKSSSRFVAVPELELQIEQVARERPVILHGIGLSICTAEFFDEAYACNLIEWAHRLDSPWVSEHLAFSRIGTGHETNAAMLLPMPYDYELLELLVPRARFFVDRLERPFLLENSVYYVRYSDQDLTEEAFLNEICRRSGCGLLLDLHNLYTNAINHGFGAADYLDALDLTNVIEIHIAGGVEVMGFHTDSHTGAVLDPVWLLLEKVIPRTTQLRGVTFEFHESSYSRLGEDGIRLQIERARSIVNRCCAGWESVSNVAAVLPASSC
jgi:uncharacterized protein